MKVLFARGSVSLSLFAAFVLIVAGCGQSDNKTGQATGQANAPGKLAAHKDDDGHDHDNEKEGHEDGHTHGEWWCADHGIPEEVCSLCSAKVEKEAKAKGDWCKDHNRAMSQCFFCQPERRDFYAAQYRAKYGKEPPPIPEFDEKKGDDKNKG